MRLLVMILTLCIGAPAVAQDMAERDIRGFTIPNGTFQNPVPMNVTIRHTTGGVDIAHELGRK